MNCIYFNKTVTGRNKGDHIVPQGLGKFSPEITIFHVCTECDSKHGNEFERVALRTGMLGTFRAIKGIKSRNHKKRPTHSPSLDKFGVLESQDFEISNISNPKETVYIGDKGIVRSANKILIKQDKKLIESIEIPPTRNIGDICDFIEENIPSQLDVFTIDLRICKEQFDEVINELKTRERKISETFSLKPESEHTIIKISSIVTENHFRFVASTVLKGMIYLGYSINLLRSLIDYDRTGDLRNLVFYYVDEQESNMDTLDDPPLNLFYHTFEWNISETSIGIAASLLAHKKVKGLRMKLSLKIGEDKSIFIPYGKIIAKYGNTPNDGILEIFHGDNKIENKM